MDSDYNYRNLNVWDFIESILPELNDPTPIANKFELDHPQINKAWWSTQREHLLHYFGYVACTESPYYEAQKVWDNGRLKSNGWLAGLIWFSEAIGVDEAMIHAAITSALEKGEPNKEAFCSVLTWQLIEEALEQNDCLRKEIDKLWSKHHKD